MGGVVVWGAMGQAKVLHEALAGTAHRIVLLVDNRDLDSPLLGIPIVKGEVGLSEWLGNRSNSEELFGAVAVGGARGGDRIALMDVLRAHALRPLTVIHRTAFVAANAELGEGCQVMAQSAVCACVRLGDGVIVNTAASVDHDCVIGRGAHIGPGARLAGEIVVGDRAFIGTGAVVLPRVRVGDDAIVGAGAVVTKDVHVGETVVGNPARSHRMKG